MTKAKAPKQKATVTISPNQDISRNSSKIRRAKERRERRKENAKKEKQYKTSSNDKKAFEGYEEEEENDNEQHQIDDAKDLDIANDSVEEPTTEEELDIYNVVEDFGSDDEINVDIPASDDEKSE